MADTLRRVMLDARVDRSGPRPRGPLSALRSVRPSRAHAFGRTQHGRRRPHPGGVRHPAPQGLHVRERGSGPRVVVVGGATDREQRSSRSGAGGATTSALVAHGAAVAGARGRARRGVGAARTLRGRALRARACGLRAVRGRGDDRARDRRDARPAAQHHVLAHPSRAAAVRSHGRGRGRAAAPARGDALRRLHRGGHR